MTPELKPDPQQRRMLARVAVVFAGLVVFRLIGDDRAGAGLLVWAGIVFAGFPIADRAGGRPAGSETMRIGSIVLGLGLGLAGAYLALR